MRVQISRGTFRMKNVSYISEGKAGAKVCSFNCWDCYIAMFKIYQLARCKWFDTDEWQIKTKKISHSKLTTTSRFWASYLIVNATFYGSVKIRMKLNLITFVFCYTYYWLSAILHASGCNKETLTICKNTVVLHFHLSIIARHFMDVVSIGVGTNKNVMLTVSW